MPSLSCDTKILAVLIVFRPGETPCPHEIREGERLFVGSDASADIILTDDAVATTHCVISAAGGIVTVGDCFSQSGTFINEEKIREVPLTQNCDIRVGTTVISAKLTRAASVADLREVAPEDKAEYEVSSADKTENDPPMPADDPASPFKTIDELQWQLDQARAENEVLQNRLAAAATTVPVAAGDPYQEEMVELLRAEVIDLQAALAEQDQASPEAATVNAEATDDDVLAHAEAEKLVGRLEELLAELQQRDEQVAMLTELLEAAEVANRAESEERSQLDAWLKEVEERFGYREQEWRAQRHKMQTELDEVTAERDRAEVVMNADTSNAKLEAAQNVMTGLRETAESQRELMLKSEQTIAELRRELELARHSQPREEQARLAEERAEIARMRQELESLRHRQGKSGGNDDALKLRALRQHLNEIHEQERKEQEEKKLSRRIARLWSRLDGR